MPTIRLLIVEDDLLVRSLAALYLRLAGFEVQEAADAAAAVAVFEAGAAVDLVFADVQLPGATDGHALAHWLQERYPRIPVILTSGSGEASVRAAAHHRRFLNKPYDLSALAGLIVEVIGRDPAGASKNDLNCLTTTP